MNSCFVKAFLLVGVLVPQTSRRQTLTMRSDIACSGRCGGFWLSRPSELGGEVQRPQPDPLPRERLEAALLALDDADGVRQRRRPGLANASTASIAAPPEVTTSSTRQTQLARLERALDPVCRPVLLGLLADDHERQVGVECRRGGERHRAELGRREPDRVRLVLGDGLARSPCRAPRSRSGRVPRRYLSR